ncbi:hypothetical protein BGZ83_005342 [Gryganskiella cystojenkinii]|nr:hypothetical protein BGZ83_005342 [Gryganskiella cystojenkinii]
MAASLPSPRDSLATSTPNTSGLIPITNLRGRHKTTAALTKTSLVDILAAVEQNLVKTQQLLEVANTYDPVERLREHHKNLFQKLGMIEFFSYQSRDCWTALINQHARILEQQHELKVEIAKLTAQEQQQERELRDWREYDAEQEKQLQYLNECIQGVEDLMTAVAKRSMEGLDKKETTTACSNALALQVTTPDGREIQPFLKLFDPELKTIRQNASLELERLSHERSTLLLCRAKRPPPPGAKTRSVTFSADIA